MWWRSTTGGRKVRYNGCRPRERGDPYSRDRNVWHDGSPLARGRQQIHPFRVTRRERQMAPAPSDHPDELTQIRAAVRALCAAFPGEYWRKLDRERAYPREFVAALTKAGFLAALIPEEYGGSGLSLIEAAAIMEEIQTCGCNGAACHAQMYTMATP